MRRKHKQKHQVRPDSKYNSTKVAMLINYVMEDGKKTIAQKIVYGAFDIIKDETNNPNPLEVFEAAVKNASPLVEVRSVRIGGASCQVPKDVNPKRRLQLALRWIVQSARKNRKTSGKPFKYSLAKEIIAASKGEGAAVKKKEDVHRMAEANKVFAHFGW